MVHTRVANPPCRRNLLQPSLRPSTISRICQRTSCLLARAHASRPTTRAARCLLGRRRCCSTLRPDTGIFPVLWVVCTTYSRSRQICLHDHPHHPIRTTSPPCTQRCRKRAQREWILGRRTRQQPWQQRLFCVSAQTAIRSV